MLEISKEKKHKKQVLSIFNNISKFEKKLLRSQKFNKLNSL